MSLYFRSLRWVIPQVMLSAPPHSQLAIISPWLRNVSLEGPSKEGHCSEGSLATLINLLVARDIQPLLFLRDDDWRLKEVRAALTPQTRKALRVKYMEHVHTKGIITNRLALTSSANLLDTSLTRNQETPINLESNMYGSTRKWLLYEQDQHI